MRAEATTRRIAEQNLRVAVTWFGVLTLSQIRELSQLLADRADLLYRLAARVERGAAAPRLPKKHGPRQLAKLAARVGRGDDPVTRAVLAKLAKRTGDAAVLAKLAKRTGASDQHQRCHLDFVVQIHVPNVNFSSKLQHTGIAAVVTKHVTARASFSTRTPGGNGLDEGPSRTSTAQASFNTGCPDRRSGRMENVPNVNRSGKFQRPCPSRPNTRIRVRPERQPLGQVSAQPGSLRVSRTSTARANFNHA